MSSFACSYFLSFRTFVPKEGLPSLRGEGPVHGFDGGVEGNALKRTLRDLTPYAVGAERTACVLGRRRLTIRDTRSRYQARPVEHFSRNFPPRLRQQSGGYSVNAFEQVSSSVRHQFSTESHQWSFAPLESICRTI